MLLWLKKQQTEYYRRYPCEGKIYINLVGEIFVGSVININFLGLYGLLNNFLENGEYNFDFLINSITFRNVLGVFTLMETKDNYYIYRIDITKLNFFQQIRYKKIISTLAKNYATKISQEKFIERREYIRFEIDGSILLTVGSKKLVGKIRNISFKGISIILPVELPIEKIYNFDITIDNTTIANLKGKIVWGIKNDIEFKYGIEFSQLGFLNKIKLINLLNRLAKQKINTKG